MEKVNRGLSCRESKVGMKKGFAKLRCWICLTEARKPERNWFNSVAKKLSIEGGFRKVLLAVHK